MVNKSRRQTTITRPAASPRGKVDWTDVRLLNASSFLAMCRQEGVTVMRTTMGELPAESNRTGAEYNIQLPSLPQQFSKDLLSRDSAPEYAKSKLPREFHEFIDAMACGDEVISKITDEDAGLFMEKANQKALSPEAIKARLPREYHDLAASFAPQDADKLPPHR